MRLVVPSQPKPNTPDFIRQQYAFTAHIRDPEKYPGPTDVEDRRMGIYRELLYNNVESFLEGNFPVIRKIIDDEAWHGMVRDFFARHESHTPYFAEIPREFIQYLQEERGERPEDPPFLVELAHYEWVEAALAIAPEEPVNAAESEGIERGGDLLEGIPLLSNLAWPLAYRFPVHKISPDVLPNEPPAEPAYLVIYRNRDDAVGFLEVNAVTFRLLQLLQEDSPPTGREAMQRIAEELAHPNPDVVVQGGLDILKHLYFLDIVIGVRATA